MTVKGQTLHPTQGRVLKHFLALRKKFQTRGSFSTARSIKGLYDKTFYGRN
jgi:hypothetical protein